MIFNLLRLVPPQQVPADDGVCLSAGCGGIYHTPRGAVRSPGFPTDYPPSSECEWEVRAQSGFRLRLSFTQTFDMETSDQCQNDFVEVRRSEQDSGTLSGIVISACFVLVAYTVIFQCT